MSTNRASSTAFERYVALTGDATASADDPAVRHFCEAYDAAREQAAAEHGTGHTQRPAAVWDRDGD